jgi:WXG100 family type VII secretion target
MATPMQAGLASLHQAAARVDEHHTALVSELNGLKADVEAIAASWQGGAHGAFQTVMAAIHEHGQTLTGTLQDMGHNIKQNANQYESHDSSFVDAIHKANSGGFPLGGGLTSV